MNKQQGLNHNIDTRQLKIGAILSYALIIFNTAYGLVISPYTLSMLGESSYGVYKTIASFSSSLIVLDLGIGTTVMRYTAKYRAENESRKIGNFVAMGLIEAAIMALVLVFISVALYSMIGRVYSAKFSSDEIQLAKSIFIIMVLNMVGTMIENVLSGTVTGMNQFVFSNGYKLLVLIMRMILIIFTLQMWHSAIVLVSISLSLTFLNIIIDSIYIRKLGIVIRLSKWEKEVFKESLAYTFLMFVQTIAIQANGNIDNIVIGAVFGATSVAVYSFGIQIFNMYESLATSFSGLMLPSISMRIANNATSEELQSIVTKVGRFQFMVLGAALSGFFVCGREFITLWLGRGYEDVYGLSLIMMVPVTFTLIENVCISILRARNLMKFRTVSLIISASLNAVITIIGTQLWNYYAAAAGTGLSVIIGWIVMNLYYHKKIGFLVFKFYTDVFGKIWFCIVLPTIICFFLNRFVYGTWLFFIIKVIVYIVVYAVLLWIYGMNDAEKKFVINRVSHK